MMIDDNESIWKVAIAALTSFFGYIVYGLRNNTAKHTKHEERLTSHDIKLATIDEQMKHILIKLTDVVDLSNDLKQSSNTILRVLARKSTK